MSKQVTAIVVGAGNRGFTYSGYALQFPDKFKIVGVCEPRQFQREKLQKLHNIPDDKLFVDWKEAVTLEKFADCALVTTQDRYHKEPAIAFAKRGYHILLEKPMAVSYSDCCEIVDACKAAGVMLAVCHVLRYSPQARKITQLIRSGAIGDVVNIQHTEPIGYYHFAHSYVRGNWRNSESSTFSLLAKSCHDFDIIQMWMGNKKCVSISSFGSLKHFTAANKPAGAASRCVDCSVEDRCPYSAKKFYLKALELGEISWPIEVITNVPDIENVMEALKTGPYGKCAYECDNNVVDNQVVVMQYEDGSTVSFTMVAFTERMCQRFTKVYGTKGELTCNFAEHSVVQFDFVEHKTIVHDLNTEFDPVPGSQLSGHGAADFFAIEAFVRAVATGDSSHIVTGPEESLRSHFMCFAAEMSRLESKVVNLTSENVIV